MFSGQLFAIIAMFFYFAQKIHLFRNSGESRWRIEPVCGAESEYALRNPGLTPRGASSWVNYFFFVINSTLGPRGGPPGVFFRAYSDTPQANSMSPWITRLTFKFGAFLAQNKKQNNCDRIWKFKLWQNSKIKNTNCDKSQKLKLWLD